MRFAPTADQRDLAATLRDALAAAGDPGRVLAELGVCGLLLPESVGGAGAEEGLVMTVLTEAGYAGVPLPLVDTLAFAPGILEGAGLEAVAAEIAEGRAWCSADLEGVGVAPGAAEIVVVPTPDGGVEVRRVRADQARSVAAVDPRAGLVRHDAGAGAVLGRCDDFQVIDRARLRATLGAAAELIGLARRMLDLTTAYVIQRRQFGVPIGSFQAVKHHLADVALAVEFAAPMVASAAAMLTANSTGVLAEARAEVSAAKVLASDAALLATRRSIQCHGAIGYTTEYDLHLFAKRAWALAAAWGSADHHRARVAQTLGLGEVRES